MVLKGDLWLEFNLDADCRPNNDLSELIKNERQFLPGYERFVVGEMVAMKSQVPK